MKDLTRYTEDQIKLARDAFMEGETYKRIAALSGLNLSAVRYYVNKHWLVEREEQSKELLLHFSGAKKKLLHSICQKSLSVLNKSVEKWLDESYTLSPKEASNVVSILTSLDKVIKLDEGNPTEINAMRENAKKVINIDPLKPQIEDAEVVDE